MRANIHDTYTLNIGETSCRYGHKNMQIACCKVAFHSSEAWKDFSRLVKLSEVFYLRKDLKGLFSPSDFAFNPIYIYVWMNDCDLFLLEAVSHLFLYMLYLKAYYIKRNVCVRFWSFMSIWCAESVEGILLTGLIRIQPLSDLAMCRIKIKPWFRRNMIWIIMLSGRHR